MNIQALVAPVVRPIIRRGVEMRVSQFERISPPPGRIVFLGDSITDQGAWDGWFPELPTLNRGISGDTVAGVRARLGTALNDPTAISLLIGTNDLGGMGTSRKVDDIASQFDDLVGAIRDAAPCASLFVNSVMPRTKAMVSTIAELNRRYATSTERVGATYVDLWPALAAADGALRDEFTADHLHLNGAGYAAWVDVLRPYSAEGIPPRTSPSSSRSTSSSRPCIG